MISGPSPDDKKRASDPIVGLKGALAEALLTPDTIQALEWRETIWALASQFSKGNCEMTHSEICQSEGGINRVVLCLNFFDKTLADFAIFLRERTDTFPTSVNKIDLAVGFNYGRPGLIEINDHVVAYSPELDILDIETSGKLTYGSSSDVRQKVSALGDAIWAKVAGE